jgi:hypothetical protein
MSESVLFNQGAPWSDADIQKLAELYFSNPKKRPFDAVIAALGRTRGAIQSEISRRGMAAPGAKLRPCLGAECYGRRLFSSEPGAPDLSALQSNRGLQVRSVIENRAKKCMKRILCLLFHWREQRPTPPRPAFSRPAATPVATKAPAITADDIPW